jgi:hypothetical protein
MDAQSAAEKTGRKRRPFLFLHPCEWPAAQLFVPPAQRRIDAVISFGEECIKVKALCSLFLLHHLDFETSAAAHNTKQCHLLY